MNISPISSNQTEFSNEIAEQCRKDIKVCSFPYQERRGDLVVMDIGTYNRREKMLKAP